MKKQDEKIGGIILNIYIDLYKASEPSADFNELVKNAEKNKDGDLIIPYNKYLIDKSKYNSIIEKHLKDTNLNRVIKSMIRNTINLGCSPKFKTNP